MSTNLDALTATAINAARDCAAEIYPDMTHAQIAQAMPAVLETSIPAALNAADGVRQTLGDIMAEQVMHAAMRRAGQRAARVAARS